MYSVSVNSPKLAVLLSLSATFMAVCPTSCTAAPVYSPGILAPTAVESPAATGVSTAQSSPANNINAGTGNAGNANIGVGNTGNTNIGVGNTGNTNTGFFNAGSTNTGVFNSGSTNTGFFNSGSTNTGLGNSGSTNTGFFNAGGTNTGSFNTGNTNTGFFNSGSTNTGLINSGDAVNSAGKAALNFDDIPLDNSPSQPQVKGGGIVDPVWDPDFRDPGSPVAQPSAVPGARTGIQVLQSELQPGALGNLQRFLTGGSTHGDPAGGSRSAGNQGKETLLLPAINNALGGLGGGTQGRPMQDHNLLVPAVTNTVGGGGGAGSRIVPINTLPALGGSPAGGARSLNPTAQPPVLNLNILRR